MKFGLNLYSIRNRLKNEEDFLAAANELREMGYSYIQFSGAAFEPEMVKRVSEASGLPVVLTHVPMDRILNDTEALVREHLSIGCKYIGLGMMPIDVIADEERCRETIAALDAAGAKMEEMGCKLFYHNHHYEFIKRGGETITEYMIKNAPHINFTFDVYWAQYGGVDICEYLELLKGRIACVHLKDYKIEMKTNAEGKLRGEPIYCPVGDGTINFPRVIEAARRSGAEYFLVEQDNAAILPDTMDQVARSAVYLKNL